MRGEISVKESVDLKKLRDFVHESLLVPAAGGDPLRLAWEQSRRKLIDAETDPQEQARLWQVLGRTDPGEACYREVVDADSTALAALSGALLARLTAGPLLTALGVTPLFAAFASAAGGAAFAVWLCLRFGDKASAWVGTAVGIVGAGTVLRWVGWPIPFLKKEAQTKNWLKLAILVVLAVLCKRRRFFDKEDAERRLMLALQCDLSSPVEAVPGPLPEPRIQLPRLEKLMPDLQSLYASSREQLSAAAEQLLLDAANLGYNSLGGRPFFALEEMVSPETATELKVPQGPASNGKKRLLWNAETAKRYEPFGSYDDGEAVIEEVPPVEFKGELRKKGLVRRAPR